MAKIKKAQGTASLSQKLSEDELKQVFGSGNSQVRFIPDEYIQAKILGMKTGGYNG